MDSPLSVLEFTYPIMPKYAETQTFQVLCLDEYSKRGLGHTNCVRTATFSTPSSALPATASLWWGPGQFGGREGCELWGSMVVGADELEEIYAMPEGLVKEL
ncbi:hypothetical protein ACJRO7_022915 [Eucalyptus globulus]|uniref:Uncharacterized protein n=1 Tax=Eucalyptus globulus TaxID=34317 RepID=A0ABD3K9I5_EUCGL